MTFLQNCLGNLTFEKIYHSIVPPSKVHKFGILTFNSELQIFTSAYFGNHPQQKVNKRLKVRLKANTQPNLLSFTLFSCFKWVATNTVKENQENMLFLLLFLFTPASVYCQWTSNLEPSNNPNDLLEKGILFNERNKILLTEKFIRVEFLVPFPTYEFTLKPDIEQLLHRLSQMWDLPSIFCPLNFSSHFASNSSGFNVNWMLYQINHEITESENDLTLIRNETSMFLRPPSEQQPRKRRGAGVGLTALAAVGLFGSGIAMGSSDSCGIRGIFGGCHDQAQANAANIRRLSDYQDILTQFVTEFHMNTEEKFYLVKNELAALNAIQAEMSATQNRNWEIIQEQFDVFEHNFHILRDCNQMLFSNQQLNFNFDTLSSLLSMVHASIKAFRSALYAFRMNVLNSIPVILRGHLPMSLIPMDSLLVILERVAIEQSKATDRLSLAIPMTDLLSYYDSRLLADAVTVPEGILMTLSIPLASRQTVFTLFEAKLIPMPYPDDPQLALKWDIEAPFLAISEDQMESSVLSEAQFNQCLGSSKYRICSETFPTEMGHSSCIATLFFDSSVDALSVCDTSLVSLPSTEQATNLGFGIWLITSANDDFIFRESHATAASSKTQSFAGCRICIITLECGMQIMTKHIKIRSDLSSCSHIPAIKLQVSLPNPLASLIMEVPPLEDLPLYDSKAEAGVKLLKQVRKELVHSPRIREVNQLVDIARPLASDMKLLKPSLTREFNQYVPFKVSFTLTCIVFVVSTVLHLLFIYIYHKYHLADRLFSKKLMNKKIKLKPCFEIPEKHKDDFPELEKRMGHRFKFFHSFPTRQSIHFDKQSPSTMAESIIGNYSDGTTQLSDSKIELVRKHVLGGQPMTPLSQTTDD